MNDPRDLRIAYLEGRLESVLAERDRAKAQVAGLREEVERLRGQGTEIFAERRTE